MSEACPFCGTPGYTVVPVTDIPDNQKVVKCLNCNGHSRLMPTGRRAPHDDRTDPESPFSSRVIDG